MLRAKAIFYIHIALFVVLLDLMQFIGWVVPSCIYTEIVLDSVINKLQCSVFYIKRAMNRVESYAHYFRINIKIVFWFPSLPFKYYKQIQPTTKILQPTHYPLDSYMLIHITPRST